MEGIKTFFESFKEFIWDIIGYLFPGLYALIILSFCVNPDHFLVSQVSVFSADNGLTITLFLSYILGYVIYGLGEFKENILGQYSYTKKKELAVSKKATFLKVKEIVAAKVSTNSNIVVDINSVRELRNFVMSTIPEFDQKVYTFMFRSEISRHVANISFSIGIIGILSTITNKCTQIDFFKTGTDLTVLYSLLIISYLFLRETRNRFYAIALSIPFSIYLSKQTANA